MKHHDINWDKQLQETHFYKKCEEMRPFMGCNYKAHRTLLVCQSYGVDKVSKNKIQINNKPRAWYGASKGDINDFLEDSGSRTWIDPRWLLERNKSHTWHKVANAIINNPDRLWKKELAKIPRAPDNKQALRECVYSHFALMNFFTRPVTVGNKFTSTDKDVAESYKTFTELVTLISPKLIVFLGKQTYDKFTKKKNLAGDIIYKGVNIKFAYSPLSVGRNWWAKPGGKETFLKIIKNNKIGPVSK